VSCGIAKGVDVPSCQTTSIGDIVATEILSTLAGKVFAKVLSV
jgi:hypothetical protein